MSTVGYPYFFVNWVDRECAEHGIEDIAALAGEGDEGLVEMCASGRFCGRFRPRENGSPSAAKAERYRARLRILFLRRDRYSPRMELPERQVTGVKST